MNILVESVKALKEKEKAAMQTTSAQENCAKPPVPEIEIEEDAEAALRASLLRQIEKDFATHERDMKIWEHNWQNDKTPYREPKPRPPALPKIPRRLRDMKTLADVAQEMNAVYRDFHYQRISADDYSRRNFALRNLYQLIAVQERQAAMAPVNIPVTLATKT